MTTASPSPRPGSGRATMLALLASACIPALALPLEDAPPAAATAGPANTTAPQSHVGSCAKPAWPKPALRAGQEGDVTLAFLIGVDGKVKQSKLIASSGFPLLDQAALDGIGRCTFKPGTADGKPGAAWLKMIYVWTREAPTKDHTEAILGAAREGAERGEAHAQYQLGLMMMSGDGVTRNVPDGMQWMRKAAAQFNPAARTVLANRLYAGIDGVTDMNEAASLYRQAAGRGWAEAQHMLGLMLLRGDGVTRDSAKAILWFRKAAAQRHAASQAYLGEQLVDKGVTAESLEEGVMWLKKSISGGDARGQMLLARCFEHGRGVPQDYAQAVLLYHQAAIAGNPEAQLGLAGLLERGQGVEPDPVMARSFQLAAAAKRTRRD